MTTKQRAVTDEQIGQFARRVHELQTRLTKGVAGFQPAMDGLQLLIEGKVVIQSGHRSLPYANEEIKSSYGYPKNFQIRSVAKQVKILLKHFPNLDVSHVQELASDDFFPVDAEGWTVIPKPDKIGTYHEAMEKVINLLPDVFKFKEWQEGKMTEKHLRLEEKTAQAHAKLNKQPGDLWVIPFQFGKRWAGHSNRNAQVRFAAKEFGLGPYEIAILLLTHPERITMTDQLYINCAGCEYDYDPDAGTDFRYDLSFYWNARYCLHYSFKGAVGEGQWGVVSGFLPK